MGEPDPPNLRTVRVPEAMAPLFAKAEEVVSAYFEERQDVPETGTIEIFGERYILVRAASRRGLAEEAGFAYKDVDEVAEAAELAGLSRRVAHLVPVGNVKG